jgi:hypothetical protein
MDQTTQIRLSRIADLDKTFGEFHNLFLDRYPNPAVQREIPTDEPKELWQLVIRAQAQVASLGPKAVRRLNRLGFDLFFGFDNARDRYAWAQTVRERELSMHMFCSISLRIEAEIGRMRVLAEIGCPEAYDNLDDDSFLISADRLRSILKEGMADPLPKEASRDASDPGDEPRSRKTG